MKGGFGREADWLALAQRAQYKAGEMAGLLEISLRQLERVFVETMMWTPQEWLYVVKLWQAIPPLLEGKSPKELFADLGFKDAASYFHAFRDYHGWTTRRYVRMHLHAESKGLGKLKDYANGNGALLSSSMEPQHLRALAFLGQMPARSEKLGFYYLRFQCREKTVNVGQ